MNQIRLGGRLWNRNRLTGTRIVKVAVGDVVGKYEVAEREIPALQKHADYWESERDQVIEVNRNLDPFGDDYDISGLPESYRRTPEELGYAIGDRVRILEALDSERMQKDTPYGGGEGEVQPSQGGEALQVGLNEIAEIIGLNVDAEGMPLSGSMLVKMPSGRVIPVFPEEVEKV